MSSLGRLEGKVTLITGGASGIGAAAAALFAREGAAVAITDTADSGEGVAQAIREQGGEAFFARGSVADAGHVETLVALVLERHGRLDVLYNNAGIGPPDDAAIHEVPEELWDRVMAVNLRGVFLCCRFGVRAMLAQNQPRSASIINTASILGLVGNPTLPSTAYTVSKGAVMALTKQVAVSYAHEGIRCNAILPGPIDTAILTPFLAEAGMRERFEERVPLGRMGHPDEVAKLALFLASDDSSFITGDLIAVDGGLLSI